MNVKFLVSLFFAVIFTAVSVSAAEISVSHTYKTKYVAPGGANYYDGPIVQTDVTVSFSHGIYVDVFNTTGLDKGNESPYGNENDYTIGFGREWGKFSFDANVSYWDCSHLFSTYPADVVVGTMSLTKKMSESVGVSVSYEHFASTNQSVFDSGMCVTVESTYSRRIIAADLDFSGSLRWDDGAFGADPALIARGTAKLSWSMGKNVTVEPLKIVVTKPLSKVNDERKTEWVFCTGVSYTF